MYWNSDSSFPASDNTWCARRPPWGRTLRGQIAVRRALRGWHPNDPILASVPGSAYLLPPICIPELAPKIHKRAKAQGLLLLAICGLMTFAFGILGVFEKSQYLLRGTVVFLLIFLLGLAQYRLILADPVRTRAYARFCSWSYIQNQNNTLLFCAIMAGAAASQIILQSSVGGLYPLVERFGLEFEKATAQPWRYLTGPFFHSGPAHWLANFVMLIIFAGMSSPIGRARSLWLVYLAGVYIPAFILTFMPHSIRSDALLGVSGGVFALMGWFGGVSVRNRPVFPYSLGYLVLITALVLALISSLLDPRSSWFCHTSGFAIGVMLGLTNYGVKLHLNHIKSLS